ncbi:MAG TPA: alpha/beta hydrolase [Terracidiphilus sp.]|jgi:pimeloyl-ACP methyl ester carboxylesterase|nr:alpha/beta hydrolase [Terracidiphilus sp.]
MNSSYEVAGARLAYAESGAGLPVVFLHPTPVDRRFWRPLLERTAEVRALTPDFRGHGASELGEGLEAGGFARVQDAPVLTMERLALDVLALLDAREIARAVFVGCSIGGYVLLELWRRAPERMRGLGFICSKPQPDTEANRTRRAATIARARAGETAAMFDEMANSLVGATARARHAEIVDAVRAQMTLTSEALVAVQAGLATRRDSLATVETIDVPVLAIAGGEDGAVTVEEMEALRAAPGGCEFHAIEDAGHFAAYEQPDVAAGLLSEWLKRFRD